MVNKEPSDYIMPFIWAVSVLMLLWSIYMNTILYYGKNKYNKLTFKPFRYATIGFMLKVIAYTLLFFKDYKIFTDDGWKRILFLFILILLIDGDYLLYFIFMIAIVDERHYLMEFIKFQKKYPQSQLDQKRSEYQMWERSER